MSEVWGFTFDPGTNIVDVCVRRLRQRIDGQRSGEDSFIQTVRSAGYVVGGEYAPSSLGDRRMTGPSSAARRRAPCSYRQGLRRWWPTRRVEGGAVQRTLTWAARAAVVGLLASSAIVAAAASAEGACVVALQHAGDGAMMAQSPDAVVLRFDEPVDVGATAVRVYSGSGETVRVGRARADGNPSAAATEVQVVLPALPDDQYLVRSGHDDERRLPPGLRLLRLQRRGASSTRLRLVSGIGPPGRQRDRGAAQDGRPPRARRRRRRRRAARPARPSPPGGGSGAATTGRVGATVSRAGVAGAGRARPGPRGEGSQSSVRARRGGLARCGHRPALYLAPCRCPRPRRTVAEVAPDGVARPVRSGVGRRRAGSRGRATRRGCPRLDRCDGSRPGHVDVARWCSAPLRLGGPRRPRRRCVLARGACSPLSAVAAPAVAVSVVTGLLLASALVPSAGALADSAYGRVLIAKLVLIGLAAAAGAMTFRAARREPRRRRPPSQRLVVECCLLGAVALLAAVLATVSSPSGPRWSPGDGGSAGSLLSARADDLLVTVRLSPGAVGASVAQVSVVDTRRPAPWTVSGVDVAVGGSPPAAATSTGGPDWLVVGVAAGGSGARDLTVTVHRDGAPDARAPFEWPPSAPSAGTGAGGRSLRSTFLLLAALVTVAACASAVVVVVRQRRRPERVATRAETEGTLVRR